VLILIVSSLCIAVLYIGWALCRVAARSDHPLGVDGVERFAASAPGAQHASAPEEDSAPMQLDREPRIHRANG